MCLSCKPLTANELALALMLALWMSSFHSLFAPSCPLLQLAVDYHVLGLNLCGNGIVLVGEWGNWEPAKGMSGEKEGEKFQRGVMEDGNGVERRKTTLFCYFRWFCIIHQCL